MNLLAFLLGLTSESFATFRFIKEILRFGFKNDDFALGLEIRLSFRLRFGKVTRSKHDACAQKLPGKRNDPVTTLRFIM